MSDPLDDTGDTPGFIAPNHLVLVSQYGLVRAWIRRISIPLGINHETFCVQEAHLFVQLLQNKLGVASLNQVKVFYAGTLICEGVCRHFAITLPSYLLLSVIKEVYSFDQIKVEIDFAVTFLDFL